MIYLVSSPYKCILHILFSAIITLNFQSFTSHSPHPPFTPSVPSLPVPPSLAPVSCPRPLPQHINIYLEFIQHHLLMGVSHIFLTAPFGWGGVPMIRLQRVLRSFILDGSVSLTSHADDSIDSLYSTQGLSWGRDTAKIFQVKEQIILIFEDFFSTFFWCSSLELIVTFFVINLTSTSLNLRDFSQESVSLLPPAFPPYLFTPH